VWAAPFITTLGGFDMARMILVAVVLVLVAPAAWTNAREDSKDAAKLVGTWTITSAEKDGKAEAATTTKGRQVKITRDTITCTDADGKTEMVASYTLDTSKTPWQIEMTCKEGDNKGKKIKGIVKLEDDTLRLCHAKPDGETPTGFKTSDGQCCFVAERKR
jgi:uncharacterized protein (TIGR03067 family)